MNEAEKADFLKTHYDVVYVKRPAIKVCEALNLGGTHGQQIIKAETERVLRIHTATFQKLAKM
jgi:hypothetical protein